MDVSDIQTWSLERLREEIQKLVPKDCKFVEEAGGGWLAASLRQGESILWADRGPDPQQVLANAFGWLTLCSQKPSHPMWKPRSTGFSRPRPAPFPKTPDRPDLDPEEIRRVYEADRQKRK